MITMKKFLFVVLITSLIPYHANGMHPNITTPEKKDIIVDPIFFIEPDMIAGIQSLGALNLASQWLGSWFGGPDPEKCSVRAGRRFPTCSRRIYQAGRPVSAVSGGPLQ